MTTESKQGKLILSPNIKDPDTFYAELINMQAGLADDDAQSAISKLLLVLANHIGDDDVLLEAIELVKNDTINKDSNT